jgi:D-proline reductase (dithiol) PrdB
LSDSLEIPRLVEKLIDGVRKWDPEFKVYHHKKIPWTSVDRPLHEAKVVLVSSAGVYHPNQEPFHASHPHGDPSIRFITTDMKMEELKIAHEHYDHKYANEDINVVFPLGRLQELQNKGHFQLANTHYSVSGYITRPIPALLNQAEKMIEQMKQEDVSLVLLVPV